MFINDTWDRTNKYDFAGRLSFNQFGLNNGTRVYEQTVTYNAFSDMTGRSTMYWGSSGSGGGGSFTNGRKTSSPAPTYDAAGNITYQSGGARTGQISTYDASGRAVSVQDKWPLLGFSAWQEDETVHVFDGDGKPVISKARTRTSANQTWPSLTTVSYQVWSSVLGTALTTVEGDSSTHETKVFGGGTHVATGDVWWTADPVSGTTAFYAGNGTSAAKEEESEPLGGQSIEMTPPPSYFSNYGEVLGKASDAEWQCKVAALRRTDPREMPVHCQKAAGLKSIFTYRYADDEKSPTYITTFETPGFESDGSPSDAVLAASNTITIKKKKAEEPPTLKRNNRTKEQKRADGIAGRKLAATGIFDIEASFNSEDWISELFSRRPNCKTRLREVLGNKFDNFVDYAKSIHFVDLRELSDSKKGMTASLDQIMQTPVTNFGITAIDDDGKIDDLGNMTMGDLNSREADAVASTRLNSVYLFPRFFESAKASQNDTKLHESFHKFFTANHVGILRALRLPPQFDTVTGGSEGVRLGRLVTPGITPLVARADFRSGIYLNAWIGRNCN